MVEDSMAAVSDNLQWSPDLASREVTVRRIEDVAFTPMSPRLRNELITQTYGDVAQAMSEALGTNDATWAGFGHRASRKVALALSVPIPGFGFLVRRAFGDGNRDVFADIGRAHATFLDTVGRAFHNRHSPKAQSIDAAWAECEKALRKRLKKPPGSPGGGSEDEFFASEDDPRGKPEHRFHNQLLVVGFRAYYRALTATEAEKKSQHILLGNCLLALHEQRLLGLALTVGLRSPIRTLTTPQGLLESRFRWRNRNPGEFRLRLESAFVHFVTKWIVGVELPTVTVHVRKPVPPGDQPVIIPDIDQDSFGTSTVLGPRLLANLDDQSILGRLLEKYSVDGGPARCWTTLDDRVAYIFALFVEHQRASGWFDEHGNVVRVGEARWFQAELSEQIERLESSKKKAETAAPDTTISPLSEERLNQLRAQPTHIETSEAHHERALHADDLADRYATISMPGQHLDRATCSAARQVFGRWSTLWFVGILFRSLPNLYAGATGVRALARLSDVLSNASLTSGLTARFLGNLLRKSGGWTDGQMLVDGPAYRSILSMRRRHSRIANRLLADGWDVEEHGPPLNQEVVLFQVLSFGVSPIAMFEQLGVQLFPHWRDSYVRFWLGIGYLLGVSYDAVTVPSPSGRQPLDFEQARALTETIRRRNHTCSIDGVRMNEALIDGIADGFPRPCGWMATGLMTVLGEEDVNERLLLGTGRGRRRSLVLAAVIRLFLGNRVTRRIGVRAIRFVGSGWLRPLLGQAGSSRPRQNKTKPDLWPTTCLGHEALEGAPKRGSKGGRRGRRRRRLPLAA